MVERLEAALEDAQLAALLCDCRGRHPCCNCVAVTRILACAIERELAALRAELG